MQISNIRPIPPDTTTRAAESAKPVHPGQANVAAESGMRREITGPLAQKILEQSGIKPVEIFRYRVQLDIHEETGRVVAEVRNKDSGELVTEVPSRTLLRQAAMLEETLGTILDKPI